MMKKFSIGQIMGWKGESTRHSLARRGVKTKVVDFNKMPWYKRFGSSQYFAQQMNAMNNEREESMEEALAREKREQKHHTLTAKGKKGLSKKELDELSKLISMHEKSDVIGVSDSFRRVELEGHATDEDIEEACKMAHVDVNEIYPI
jgi:uncharacterized protein YjaZ